MQRAATPSLLLSDLILRILTCDILPEFGNQCCPERILCTSALRHWRQHCCPFHYCQWTCRDCQVHDPLFSLNHNARKYIKQFMTQNIQDLPRYEHIWSYASLNVPHCRNNELIFFGPACFIICVAHVSDLWCNLQKFACLQVSQGSIIDQFHNVRPERLRMRDIESRKIKAWQIWLYL